MPFPLQLSQEEYEALINLARAGADTSAKQVRLDTFLRALEKKNGVTRYGLWVQWQEANSALPTGTSFPSSWPPSMRYFLELVSRPIARSDVDAILAQRAINPVSVLVTTDPAATIGWTELDDYFR